MIMIASFIILSVMFIKYKPVYTLSVSGEEIGYIKNKQAFEETIKENIVEGKNNIDNIDIKSNPQYELKLVDRKIETNEKKVLEAVENDIVVTYKYYDINLNNEVIEAVDTIDEAEELVNKVKQDNQDKQLELSIIEKYTEKSEEVNTTAIETAKNDIQTKIVQNLEEQEKKKKEEERINSMPEVNGVKLAYTPITGVISSRYASSESVRDYRAHSGLDIAAPAGTKIKAVASGTVVTAGVQGGYGNLVRLSHGNGVETYYGHCSKLLVSKGQTVNAGEIIALVGSTGHSTGPHLHLEIRINGQTVNPQKYLYK